MSVSAPLPWVVRFTSGDPQPIDRMPLAKLYPRSLNCLFWKCFVIINVRAAPPLRVRRLRRVTRLRGRSGGSHAATALARCRPATGSHVAGAGQGGRVHWASGVMSSAFAAFRLAP